jgi:hypothetical protein
MSNPRRLTCRARSRTKRAARLDHLPRLKDLSGLGVAGHQKTEALDWNPCANDAQASWLLSDRDASAPRSPNAVGRTRTARKGDQEIAAAVDDFLIANGPRALSV